MNLLQNRQVNFEGIRNSVTTIYHNEEIEEVSLEIRAVGGFSRSSAWSVIRLVDDIRYTYSFERALM